LIYGQRVLPDGTAPKAGINQRVSQDPPLLPLSGDQDYPAIAYHPSSGHALVVWQDNRYNPDRAYWGIWGRIWMPVERVFLPLVLRASP
jgi:hypothetical protein